MDDRRSQPAPFAASIVSLNGELEGKRFPLKMMQYIGLMYCSDSEIAMTTTALGTSRRHLALECIDGAYFAVTDNQSTHGTFVNGKEITPRQALVHGDVIAAGKAEFRYEIG